MGLFSTSSMTEILTSNGPSQIATLFPVGDMAMEASEEVGKV